MSIPRGIDKYFGPAAPELASRVGSFIRNGIMNKFPFDPVDFHNTMADLPDDEQNLAHTFLADATEALAMGAEGRPLWAQQQLDDVIKWYFVVKLGGRQAKRQKYDQDAGQPSVVFRDRVAVGMMLVGCQDAATHVKDIHVNHNCASFPAQGLRHEPFPNERAREPGRNGWRDGMAAHERGLAVNFGKRDVMRRAESQSHERASVERGRARNHCTISERQNRARERSRSVSPWENEEEYGRSEHRRSERHVPQFSPRGRDPVDDSPERRRKRVYYRRSSRERT